MTLTQAQATTLPGRTAVDSFGDKVGAVSALFTSNTTGEPEWVTLKHGIFGSRENFAPLTGAVINSRDELALAVPLSLIREAPGIDDNDGQLSSAEVTRLYRHYGMTPTTATGSPVIVTSPNTTSAGSTVTVETTVNSVVPDPEPTLQRYVVTEETRQVGKEPI